MSLPVQSIYRNHKKGETNLSIITSSLSHNKHSDLQDSIPEYLYDNWDIEQYYRVTNRHIVLSAKHKKTDTCHVLIIIPNKYFYKKLWKDLICLPDSKLLLPQKIQAIKNMYILEFPVYTSLKNLVQTEPISLSKIITIILDLCASLNCLHDAGILHMDISADNVYLTQEQHFILGDFSESCFLTEARYPLSNYISSFIAPECQKKAPSIQSEQYQLGILFYQLCNLGNDPPKDFQGIIPQNLPVFQSTPEISNSIQTILSKMLAQDPFKRYSDLSALQQDLKSLSSQNLDQSDYQLFLPDETHPFHQTITVTNSSPTEIHSILDYFHLPSFHLSSIQLPSFTFLIPCVLVSFTLIFIFVKVNSTTENKAKQITEVSQENTTTGASIFTTDDMTTDTGGILDIANKNINSFASSYPNHIQANTIYTLFAENNHISSLSDLSLFPNLREIYLSNNQISDIQDLAILSNLKVIILSDNCCTNVSDLKTLHKLRFLDLSGNSELMEVYDLHNLKSLKTLILSDTSVTENSVKQLQQMLPECNIIF